MKGSVDCHIPNQEYRNNYDRIFRQISEEDEIMTLKERSGCDLVDEMMAYEMPECGE